MKELSPFKRPYFPAPASYDAFIFRMKEFAKGKNLIWQIPLSADGLPVDGHDWDLRVLVKSHARYASHLNGFAINPEVRADALASGFPVASVPHGAVLNEQTQDFIKAIAVFRSIKGIQPVRTASLVRVLRNFFSYTVKAPWDLCTADFEYFSKVRQRDVHACDQLVAIARIMSAHMLSVHCPLRPRIKTSLSKLILQSLEQRSHKEKLPSEPALLELTRICFRENPLGHIDLIRFSVTRMLILTGLRLNEVIYLPANCLHWVEYMDVVTGQRADSVGGIGRRLEIRYFAEKHVDGAADVLAEAIQHVPQEFEDLVDKTVREALKATHTLRKALRQQIKDQSLCEKSDCRIFLTSAGRRLDVSELLFLVVYNSQSSGDGVDRQDLPIRLLAGNTFCNGIQRFGKRSASLFAKYGSCDEAKLMSVKPHSLRHLKNTEMFRLGLSDTVISKHFNRRSIAQSHVYDHRSLAQRLDGVSLPAAALKAIPEGSSGELVAKMLVSGFGGQSHTSLTFKKICAEHGDEAGFDYLAAKADGMHVTPYGICLSNFASNPCDRHLKCFDRCKNFAASGLPAHKHELGRLRSRYIKIVAIASSKHINTIGRSNQIAHAQNLIEGIDSALLASSGEEAFPLGIDHSVGTETLL